MIIPSKHDGYGEGGRLTATRRVYDGGGAPAQTTAVSDLPDWAKGTAQKALGLGESLVFQKDATGAVTGLQPYQQYTGERVAQFTPLQQQAFEGVGALGVNPLTQQAAQQALGMGYSPGSFNAAQAGQTTLGEAPTVAAARLGAAPQAAGITMGAAPTTTAAQMQGPQNINPSDLFQLQQYQMGPAERVRTQSFIQPGASQAYMSPYMQDVVNVQQREARRASEILRNQQQAQAVGQGAYGGSRQAIVEAERQRNLATQLGDIQAGGLQSAFQQAQQQFNTEQQARLAAQQANQQAGLTVGGQNLAARLGVQQLGAQTGLQAALANQQAAYNTAAQNAQLAQQAGLANQAMAGQFGLTGAQLAQQTALANQAAQQQYGLTQGQYEQQAAMANQALRGQYGLTGAQLAQQINLANQQAAMQAQQLGEQSRQFGAGIQMQGIQAALQGAQQAYNQQLQAAQAQAQAGALQQAQTQNVLSQQYQDFLNQQKYPYQQAEYLSSLVRGTPTGQVQTMYQPAPSMASQVLGAGTALAGASMVSRAKGGSVNSGAGLADLAVSTM